MSRIALIAVGALCLSGCWNGGERAPGAPHTDITATSTETYATAIDYYVIDSSRDGSRLTLDINVRDLGRADEFAREAAADRKGGASQVVVNVYGPAGHPPQPPVRTVIWKA